MNSRARGRSDSVGMNPRYLLPSKVKINKILLEYNTQLRAVRRLSPIPSGLLYD
jgi:hypothetical protein